MKPSSGAPVGDSFASAANKWERSVADGCAGVMVRHSSMSASESSPPDSSGTSIPPPNPTAWEVRVGRAGVQLNVVGCS